MKVLSLEITLPTEGQLSLLPPQEANNTTQVKAKNK